MRSHSAPVTAGGLKPPEIECLARGEAGSQSFGDVNLTRDLWTTVIEQTLKDRLQQLKLWMSGNSAFRATLLLLRTTVRCAIANNVQRVLENVYNATKAKQQSKAKKRR